MIKYRNTILCGEINILVNWLPELNFRIFYYLLK